MKTIDEETGADLVLVMVGVVVWLLLLALTH